MITNDKFEFMKRIDEKSAEIVNTNLGVYIDPENGVFVDERSKMYCIVEELYDVYFLHEWRFSGKGKLPIEENDKYDFKRYPVVRFNKGDIIKDRKKFMEDWEKVHEKIVELNNFGEQGAN